MKFNSAVLALAIFSSSASALSAAQWKSQSIYQVITDRFARTDNSTTATCNTGDGIYCGGSWRGIINKLDYIQNMGFTAVSTDLTTALEQMLKHIPQIWISPIVKNLEGNSADGESYHGYWAQDIYSLNDHFGTEQNLLDLSAALHSRGMYLMVDVVTNHMGYLGCGTCVDYSVFNPFNSVLLPSKLLQAKSELTVNRNLTTMTSA